MCSLSSIVVRAPDSSPSAIKSTRKKVASLIHSRGRAIGRGRMMLTYKKGIRRLASNLVLLYLSHQAPSNNYGIDTTDKLDYYNSIAADLKPCSCSTDLGS